MFQDKIKPKYLDDDEIVIVAQLFGLDEIRQPSADAPLQIIDFENQCLALIHKYELQMIILTCGSYGSYVITLHGITLKCTPKVKVADTVGAGDSFTGSFCASLLAGKSIAEAHDCAVEVSAFVCTQNGAMPEYPAELKA